MNNNEHTNTHSLQCDAAGVKDFWNNQLTKNKFLPQVNLPSDISEEICMANCIIFHHQVLMISLHFKRLVDFF